MTVTPDIPSNSGSQAAITLSVAPRLVELRRNWQTLIGSSLGVGLGVAVYPVYVVPLLGLEFERSFGWSRTDAAFLPTAVTIGALVAALIGGRIIDALGTKWPAVVSTVAMGLLLAAAPLASSSTWAWQIGAFFFALLGGATLPITFARAVCDVFRSARGLALGIVFGAIGLAGAILPSILIPMIAARGPGGALQIAGIGYVFVLAPVVALLLRSNSTSDGGEIPAGVAQTRGSARGLSWWSWSSLGLGFVLLAGAGVGAASSLPGFMRDAGLGSAVGTMAGLSLAAMISRPLAGLFIDLMPAQWVGAAIALLTAAGLVLLPYAPALAPLCAVLIGICLGAEFDVLAYLVSRYAEPEKQSRVYGLLYALVVASVALGPIAMAQGRQLAGGYGPALLVAAAAAVIGAGLLWRLPAYTRLAPGNH